MTTIKLKNIPNDLHDHLIKVQAEMKIEKKVSQFSLENTVLKIVREHKERAEVKKKG